MVKPKNNKSQEDPYRIDKLIADIKNVGDNAKETHVKILIYGDSGAGKTFLTATSPKPLFLLNEANGQASILHSNKDADILLVKDANALAKILHDIDTNPQNWSKYDTICIDSLTEMQRLIKDRITDGRQMSLPMWGKLADDMRKLIRRIRNLKFNVVCTALLEKDMEEATGERHVRPLFEGKKTGAEIAQYFSMVGLLYNSTDDNGATCRSLMLDGPSRVMCKPVFPLEGSIQKPDLTNIINQIQTTQAK